MVPQGIDLESAFLCAAAGALVTLAVVFCCLAFNSWQWERALKRGEDRRKLQ